jgi:hypothetical protein
VVGPVADHRLQRLEERPASTLTRQRRRRTWTGVAHRGGRRRVRVRVSRRRSGARQLLVLSEGSPRRRSDCAPSPSPARPTRCGSPTPSTSASASSARSA